MSSQLVTDQEDREGRSLKPTARHCILDSSAFIASCSTLGRQLAIPRLALVCMRALSPDDISWKNPQPPRIRTAVGTTGRSGRVGRLAPRVIEACGSSRAALRAAPTSRFTFPVIGRAGQPLGEHEQNAGLLRFVNAGALAPPMIRRVG